MMRLVDLPADVLLKILGLCDVEDVLRVETTCRVLRDVAATRHLWVSHLRGLPNECPPDLPPHVSLESLDCADLKTLVGRAVRGSRNWNSPFPEVTREIKVIFDKPIQEPAFVRKASLVPGGDYLVVQWSAHGVLQWVYGYLHLLEVSNGEEIRIYSEPDSYSGLMSRKLWAYGVDRITENILRVATVETEIRVHKLASIKVFEVDLRQRRSEKIYDHQLNVDSFMQLPGLYLQGDHIILVDCKMNLIFLNWKSFCCTNLTCDEYIEASQLVRGFLFTIHRPEYPAKNFILRVTDVHQALEAVSGQERSPLTIRMNTSPAVTEADLRSDSSAPNTIDVQAFNAFWKLYLGDIYICLFASIYGDQSAGMMVLSYSFTPQTRTFEHKYTASLLLDDDEPHSLIVSSQSGRLAVSGYQGVYGSDIHRILRDGLNDTLCHKVLPDGIDCFGMDPYSGAILWISKQSLSTEIGISYFD